MRNPREILNYCLEEKPLLTCIWLAFFFRMIAVFFSQGIAFGYDHYVYVEVAQELVNRHDISLYEFFTTENNNFLTHGFSIVYLWINYAILQMAEAFNIFDPKSKMFMIRIVHALASLLVVYYSYGIAYTLSTRRRALTVGVMAACLWFYPFCSVRSLSENISCILLLAAVYRIAKGSAKIGKHADDLFTGFLMSVGFSVSYNCAFFIIGVLFCIAIRYGFKRSLYFLCGVFISFILFEGLLDLILFKQPFIQFIETVFYSFNYAERNSGTSGYYMYISILLLVFLMPWGGGFIYGFIKSWKKYFMMFIPTVFYIICLQIMPYKQEHFIVNIIPFYIILCVLGWHNYRDQTEFWRINKRLYSFLRMSFWIINLTLLMFVSVAYTRKAQIEAMVWMSRFKSENPIILVEDTEHTNSKSLPPFYFGRNVLIYTLNKTDMPDISIYRCYICNKNERAIYTDKYFVEQNTNQIPAFVVFYGDKEIPARTGRLRAIFPNLTYAKTITPSICDRLISYFNSSNINEPLHIYTTNWQ